MGTVRNAVHSYCLKRRLNVNVCKSAVMNFGKRLVESKLEVGEQYLPRVPYQNIPTWD